MKNALFTCVVCKDIFRNRTDLKNHVRRDHQSAVKVKFQNGGVTEVKRAEDNTFKCKCGKSFKLPDSLRRHAKGCNDELTESEESEGEGALMDAEEDSDASESMDMDDRVVSTDCFRPLISHEKC
jgi:Zinc finger, C2H2 type